MFATIVGRILGAIGVMALTLWAMIFFFVPETPGASWIGATAAVGIAAWVYLDWDALARFFGSRGGREQLVSALLIVIVAVICGLLMFLAAEHPKRWDLTESSIHSLDARTEQILRDIPSDLEVEVTGFFVSSFDRLEDGKRRSFQRVVDAAKATGSKADFDLVDPEVSPLRASQAGVTSNGTVIITARPKSGGDERTERLYSPDEQELANALTRVIAARRSKVVFVSGHGERLPSTAGERGLSVLAQHLKDLGFEIGNWNSATDPDLPADADVLVIAGPTLALDTREASLVRQWVEDGGALLLMAEPTIPGKLDGRTGLEGALLSWGLRLEDDLVLDEMMSRLGGDPAAPIADRFGYHEITEGFDLPIIFATARSVSDANDLPQQVTVFELAKTGDRAWGETGLAEEEVSFSEDDNKGPLTLIALAELHRGEDTGKGRVIVAGDVDWSTNGMIVSRGNMDFVSRSIGWLAKDDDVIKIPPKESSEETMELSMLQVVLMVFGAVFAVPGGAALTGIIVWVWRRGL